MLPKLGVDPPPRIKQADEIAAHALSAEGRVVATVLCVNCSYDLRMQTAASNCPECGVPISTSLRSHWLFFSKPGRIRIIRTGLWLLTTAWFVGAAVVGFSLLPWLNNSFLMFASAWWAPTYFGSLLFGLALFLPGAVLVSWRASTNETTATSVLRWSARASAGVTCLIAGTSYFLWYRIFDSPMFAGDSDWILDWYRFFTIASQFIATAAAGLLLWYERSLARRIPSPRLVRWVLVTFVFAMLGHGVNVIVMLLPIANPLTGRSAFSLVVYIPWGLGELLELTVYIALLRGLKPVVRRAEANWRLAR